MSHAFFGTGNGSFQQYQSDGVTLLSTIQNWSRSVLDFKQSSSAFDPAPSQYFTPYGGVPVQEPTGSTTYTVTGMNQDDFDMAVSGIMLFQYPIGDWRALTIDKAGYGYLLTVGNLCGDGSAQCYPAVSQASGGKARGRAGDPGNAFPFAALSRIRGTYPLGANVLNPGGLLAVTSDSGNGGLLRPGTYPLPVYIEGTLFAYDAESMTLKVVQRHRFPLRRQRLLLAHEPERERRDRHIHRANRGERVRQCARLGSKLLFRAIQLHQHAVLWHRCVLGH